MDKNPTKKCPECFAEVPAQAKKCSHCGSKLPQPTSLTTKIIGGFFALMVLFIIISTSMSGDSSSSQPTKEPNYELSARAYSEVYIERMLKSPSTAKFCRGTVSNLGDNKWKVSSCVDSQNSFGAMIRSDWEVTMAYTGGDPESMSSWNPEKIVFDGKVIR